MRRVRSLSICGECVCTFQLEGGEDLLKEFAMWKGRGKGSKCCEFILDLTSWMFHLQWHGEFCIVTIMVGSAGGHCHSIGVFRLFVNRANKRTIGCAKFVFTSSHCGTITITSQHLFYAVILEVMGIAGSVMIT